MAKRKLRALDIGSGHNPVERTGWWKEGDMSQYDFVKMDLYHEDANVKHDFSEIPYPFPDSHFDAVFARHSLEHVGHDKLVDVMREIHRIAKHSAQVYIRVPYGVAFIGDPTHRYPFTEDTLARFCHSSPTDTGFYIPQIYEMMGIEFRFTPKFASLPKRLCRELMHIWAICDELWAVLGVVKDVEVRPYNPVRKYSFNPYGIGPRAVWRQAAFYGIIFYGGIFLVGVLLVDLLLRLLGS